MNDNLKVSDKLIDMLKFYEGLARKRSDGKIEAYLDTLAKPPKWTIGWGHTKTARQGMVITEREARELKKQDLEEHENNVKELITVQLTQGQFDALVSFCYNTGRERFRQSDVRKLVNKNDFNGAQAKLRKYTRAGGRVAPGLVSRRNAEIALMNEAEPPKPAQPIAYNNNQMRRALTPPNSLWGRLTGLFAATT